MRLHGEDGFKGFPELVTEDAPAALNAQLCPLAT